MQRQLCQGPSLAGDVTLSSGRRSTSRRLAVATTQAGVRMVVRAADRDQPNPAAVRDRTPSGGCLTRVNPGPYPKSPCVSAPEWLTPFLRWEHSREPSPSVRKLLIRNGTSATRRCWQPVGRPRLSRLRLSRCSAGAPRPSAAARSASSAELGSGGGSGGQHACFA